jgi:hypothetical protein
MAVVSILSIACCRDQGEQSIEIEVEDEPKDIRISTSLKNILWVIKYVFSLELEIRIQGSTSKTTGSRCLVDKLKL